MTGPTRPDLQVELMRGVPYGQAQDRMLSLLDQRITGQCGDTLLLVEPQPVYTVGRRRGAADHILATGDVPVVTAARGGDVTFHGPGQIMGWPIVALPAGRQDLHLWLHGLELVVLRVLHDLGLHGQRDARNTGVWLGGRKVCAIGIGCRRWVTWHGFALNLSTHLRCFDRINPCGLGPDTVTRIQDHLPAKRVPDWERVATSCAHHLQQWWQAPDAVAQVATSLEARPPRQDGRARASQG